MKSESAFTIDNHEADDETRWSSLMLRAQTGDNGAYQTLLTELTAVTGAVLIKRLGYQCLFLDDCTQEVLLAIHKARHTYDNRQPFKPWFFAIVRNKSVDFIRKHVHQGRHVVQSMDDEHINQAPSPTPHIEEVLATESALNELLEALPEGQRDAIIKTKLEGKSLKEAAKELDITEAALKVRVHRAVGSMKKLFKRGQNEK